MAEYLQTEGRKAPDGAALRKEGKRWIERIEAAATHEKDWMDDADKAVMAYTGEKQTGGSRGLDFNILYSNVETIVPAIINSPPQPDIRRRFADDDPVAKDGSELLERAIRIQVDDSRLQIEMEGGAQDAFLAGRGIVRLRFKADVEGEVDNDDLHELAREFDEESPGDGARDADDDARAEEGDQRPGDGGEPAAPASVKNERICFEAVSWRDYRHGPAKRWEDRPWEAYRHAMPMEDIEQFADRALADAQSLPEDKLAAGDTDNDVVIWEVWCRKSGKVKFIENDTGKILKILKDPLGLKAFFPCCTPMQPIELVGRLMPVNPFSIYRKLADELDTTTRRISAITKQMRVRGWYSGDATELANMLDADDTDFVPIANPELWAQNGGLEGAVAFWPIERFIQALRELYVQREQTKQAIYEITGISDIVRGASKSSETATAQNIKSQWGSLRIQKMQRMMERAARDLFVMMAEIIPAKFSAETLQKMTGIQLIPTQQDLAPLPAPPQPPMDPNADPEQQQQMQQMYEQAVQQHQQAEQQRQKKLAHLQALNDLLNDDVASFYRIDVESDSTVRADLTQKKQDQAEFLQGAAAYFQGIVPAIEIGAISQEGAIEIFAATARLFTLGKSTEDALEREIASAKERAAQPKPPSPEQIKAEQEAKKTEADMQARQMDMQAAQEQQRADMEMQQAEGQQKLQEAITEANAKREEYGLKLRELQVKGEADRLKAENDVRIGEINLQLKQYDLLIKKADLVAKGVEASEDETDVVDRSERQTSSITDALASQSQALSALVEQLSKPKSRSITTPDGRVYSATEN